LPQPHRHLAVFSADDYPDEVPVPSFQARMKCGKCGAVGRQIDVRPNWKEQPVQNDGEGVAVINVPIAKVGGVH
jgi:hypothetical protein